MERGCRGLFQDTTSPSSACILSTSTHKARQTGLQLIEIEPGASELPLHQTARSTIHPFTDIPSNYWLILCSDIYFRWPCHVSGGWPIAHSSHHRDPGLIQRHSNMGFFDGTGTSFIPGTSFFSRQ
jgi:hypothetical protein